MFWRIHGWIEAKWKAFERAHRRTPAEQQSYNTHMANFRRTMESRGPAPVHVPSDISQNVRCVR